MITELMKQIHENAKAKGWWETPRDPLAIHMLIVGEIAEAMEEVRNGKPDYYWNHLHNGVIEKNPEDNFTLHSDAGVPLKPEGELVELADAIIRIMDYCGHKGWDLESAIQAKVYYNKTRPYRHGGKKA